MNLKLVLAAAPIALLATPALAAVPGPAPIGTPDTGTVNINGKVAPRCMFTTNNKVITIPELAQGAAGAAPGSLDPSTVNNQSATLVGWCNNTSASMTVQATPLTNGATAASGFVNRIDYTASATANDVTATGTSTSATAGSPASVNMFTGNILVSLSNAATTGGLLVAGAYNGTVTVTLQPTVTPS